MSHYYLDASVVVKRYYPETGSAWIRSLNDPAAGYNLVIGEITLVEVAAALAAKHRIPQGISRAERDAAVAVFLSHCDTEYELVATDRSSIDRAVSPTQSHRLRGYDAVQLATALTVNEILAAAGLTPLVFVSADNDLMVAARAEGLETDSPSVHP